MNQKIKFNNTGFSLVELIVVVTIILVISTVAIVNFAGANQKSRDSRRMADLEKVRIALEMIRQVGTTYPASTGLLVPNYIQSVPTGPKGDSYRYQAATNGYSFTLDAKMEDLGSTNGSFGSGYNYRVTNP